jgi:hypothetical protein
MDNNLSSADDYVVHAETALGEARSQITRAAGVFIDNAEAREALGDALGQAHNAISRAQRDLGLHRARERRRDDRDSADAYLPSIGFPDDGRSVAQIAVVPLPLEEARIPLDQLADDKFDRDLTKWITDFNNEHRRRSPYLMAVPGNMGSSFENEHRRYATTPQVGTEPSQCALIYPSGAFVYWQPLWRHYNPPRFFLAMVQEDARMTLTFAAKLYDELQIIPRAIAVQGILRRIEDFQMMVPGYFEHAPNTLVPKSDVSSVPFPSKPIVLTGALDKMVARVLPAIEASIREQFVQSH